MTKNKANAIKAILAIAVGLFITKICGITLENIIFFFKSLSPYASMVLFTIFFIGFVVLWSGTLAWQVNTNYWKPLCYSYDCWKNINYFNKENWKYECKGLILILSLVIISTLAYYFGKQGNWLCDCTYTPTQGFDYGRLILLYPAWESLRFLYRAIKLINVKQKEDNKNEK